MTTEYRVQFRERLHRTPLAVSYLFSRPDSFTFRAGQYMIVALDRESGLAHPLSLSDSPDIDTLEFTKRMTDSPFCTRLKALTPGDTIALKGPFGNFAVPDTEKPLVFLAGGIGITPIRSMLKELANKKERNQGRITLLYGNQDETDIAFRDELDNLNLPQYRVVHVLAAPQTEEYDYSGFISADILRREINTPQSAIYLVSGPPVMVDAMEKILQSLQIPAEHVLTDVFLGYTA